MYGKGLLKGLAVTGKQAVSKRMTEKYPEEKPYLAECFRGGNFQLELDNCIACGLCVKACPNKAIEVISIKDENGKKTLSEYWVDRQYCLYCGFCVDACPKNALHFTMDFENAVYSRFDVPVNLVQNPNLNLKASSYGAKAKETVVKNEVKKAANEVASTEKNKTAAMKAAVKEGE